MQTDLFGHTRKPRKSRLRSVTERYDRDTLEARVARLVWLNKVFPTGYGFGMPFESFFVFDEAKMTFLNGQFIATSLLATAFIEHRFASVLAARGFVRESRAGFKRIVATLRAKGWVNSLLLDKVDLIRQRRNPFVHLKEFNHAHNLARRSVDSRTDPYELIESDAKEALTVMYTVAIGKGAI
ncbi:MAG: hypothetical protein ABR505_00530 [Actinomycetota bacterium]